MKESFHANMNLPAISSMATLLMLKTKMATVSKMGATMLVLKTIMAAKIANMADMLRAESQTFQTARFTQNVMRKQIIISYKTTLIQ